MPKNLKVLSWNVHYPKFASDPSYAIDYFQSSRPDVICLQEYCDANDDEVVRWFNDNDYIQEYMPFAHNLEGFSQGIMTAVKQKLNPSSNTVKLRDTEPRTFRNFPNIRGVIQTTVVVDGVEIDILNTHLTFPRPYTIDMRREEFKALTETTETLERSSSNPLILVGDFNFLPVDIRRKTLQSKYATFTGDSKNKTWQWMGKQGIVSANLDAAFWDPTKIEVNGELGELVGYDHKPLKLDVVPRRVKN